MEEEEEVGGKEEGRGEEGEKEATQEEDAGAAKRQCTPSATTE